ncbi:DUF2637 domain-containing protein, partial [Streptomyces sp. NPDC055796]
EALMPLRLARIGVPLAQTAPEGLAAAGIDPLLLPPAAETGEHLTVERADALQGAAAAAPAVLGAQASTGSADMDESVAHAVEPAIDPAHDGDGRGYPYGPAFQGPRTPTRAVAPAAAELAPMTDAVLWEAYRSYTARMGEAPDSAAFVAHLADAYGVVDPVTGGPLPATEVEELLAGFPGRWTALADAGSETGGRGEPHPFFDPFTVRGDVHAPAVKAPVSGQVPAAPLASAGDRLLATRREQMSPDVLTDTVLAPAGETEHWEATVTDTGAAAARLPEQQTEEPVLDPVRQQILTVAAWLTEAEETGVKLTGAEVARRLGVSPKTGQRRVIDAGRHLTEQRRQQGRARLRSV